MEATGNRPPALVAPEFPDIISHLWEWFIELHNARPRTGMGASPIAYSEIVAWSSLTRVTPSPWEVGIIKKIDSMFMDVSTKKVR